MAFDRYDEQVYMAYIEEELLPDEAGTFEELLNDVNDPRLGDLVEAMKQDRQAVMALPREQAPPRVMQNINRIIEREKQLHPYRQPVPQPAAEPAEPVTAGSIGRSSWLLYAGIGVAAAILLGVLAVFAAMALGAPKTDPYLSQDLIAERNQQREERREAREAANAIEQPGGLTDNPVPLPAPQPENVQPQPEIVETPPQPQPEPAAEAWTPQVAVAVSGRNAAEVKRAVAFWAALNDFEVYDANGNLVDLDALEGRTSAGRDTTSPGGVNATINPGSRVEAGLGKPETFTVHARLVELPSLVQYLNRNEREKAQLSIGDVTFDAAEIELIRANRDNNRNSWRELLTHKLGPQRARQLLESGGAVTVTVELQ